jgi:hypothetical protein
MVYWVKHIRIGEEKFFGNFLTKNYGTNVPKNRMNATLML